MIFSTLRDRLGDEVLMGVLSTLSKGGPNVNHRAVRHLAPNSDSGLAGVITPNFDTYIEQALDGMDYTIHLPNRSEKGDGFPVVKPYGTLTDVRSIQVALEYKR